MIKISHFIVIIALLSPLLYGCGVKEDKTQISNITDEDMAKLNEKIDSLWNQIYRLEEQLEFHDFQKQLFRLENRISELEVSSELSSTAIFDPELKGYTTLHTDSGFFLIGFESHRVNDNGDHEVDIMIGNPSTASYVGFDITVKWGKKFEDTEYYKELGGYGKWQDTLKRETIHFDKELVSGYWNSVDMRLKGSEGDNAFDYMEISLTLNKVGFDNVN